VVKSIRAERKRLDPVRNVADIVLDTTKFNVHELRAHINTQFEREESDRNLTVSSNSFGFRMACRRRRTWCSMCGFCRILILCRSFAS